MNDPNGEPMYRFVVRASGRDQEYRSVKEAFENIGRGEVYVILVANGASFKVLKP